MVPPLIHEDPKLVGAASPLDESLMVASIVSSLLDIAIHRRQVAIGGSGGGGGGGGGSGGGGPAAGLDLPLQLAVDLIQRTLDSADDRAAQIVSDGGVLKQYLNVEERASMLELAISLGAHHERISTPPIALLTRAVQSVLGTPLAPTQPHHSHI